MEIFFFRERKEFYKILNVIRFLGIFLEVIEVVNDLWGRGSFLLELFFNRV